jgi:RNA polymerase-binding transcription factor DksA
MAPSSGGKSRLFALPINAKPRSFGSVWESPSESGGDTPAVPFDDGRRNRYRPLVAEGGLPMTADRGPDDLRSRLAEMRTATVQRIDELGRSFDDIVESASDVATDDEHDPEGHTIAWERQQVAALLADARSALTSIDAALSHLDEGNYGTCTSCGSQIEPARLEALPATPHCLRCAR